MTLNNSILRAPAPTPTSFRKQKNRKYSEISMDSSREMAPTFIKASLKRKAAQLPRKKKKKKTADNDSNVFSLDESQFFSQSQHVYMCKTVNSFADVPMGIPDGGDDKTNTVRKKKKKKAELIDSEVELMMSKEERPPLRYSDIAPAHKRPVEVIEHSVIDAKVVQKPSGKKRIKKKVNKVKVESKEEYPVLKDKALMTRFLSVPLTNNQKGRIRQIFKDMLTGTSKTFLPEVINNKILAILNSSQNLTDTDLRKIRVLFNMLKTATEKEKLEEERQKEEEALEEEEVIVEEVESKIEKKSTVGKKADNKKSKDTKSVLNRAKRPKRYVVFVGNLPPNVTKEEIKSGIFSDIYNYVIDVRIPKLDDNFKSSSIAYVEVSNHHSYEIALSKHHTMLGRRRINVLYTSQTRSKISRIEAKAKVAKLVAMQKNGQLIGSTPLNKKRSARRAKQRRAMHARQREETQLNDIVYT